MNSELGFELTLNVPYEQAIEVVTTALKTQGFGVLTSIDVRNTMREKLDVDFRPYTILGACNPPLAHRALTHMPEIGLLLPCNVTIEEVQASQALVRFVNPEALLQSFAPEGDTELADVGADALRRFKLVIDALK